jgi:hypothetical protein
MSPFSWHKCLVWVVEFVVRVRQDPGSAKEHMVGVQRVGAVGNRSAMMGLCDGALWVGWGYSSATHGNACARKSKAKIA